MKEIIYHSSYMVVDKPLIEKGKHPRDFGYGFYCIKDQKQAKKLAAIYTTPVVNIYELGDISDLKIKVFKEYNAEWLDFVVHCRNGGKHDFDIIEGFVADDTVLEVIDEYLDERINKKALLDMMKSEWSDRQISFHTERALSKLVFLGSK